MTAKQVLIAIGIILLAIILIQNSEAVRFKFLFWQFGILKIILLIIIGIIGFIAGYLVASKGNQSRS